MMETGKKIKRMDLEDITTPMVPSTKEIGTKTSNMAMVKKSGLTTLSMRDSTSMVRNMVRVSSTGQTGQPTLVISLTTTSTDKVSTRGPMVVNIQVSGTLTRCTVQACSHGLTEENTKGNILMIRKKVMVFSNGLMVANMMASGRMESNTVKGNTFQVKEKPRPATGTKENAFNGLKRQQKEWMQQTIKDTIENERRIIERSFFIKYMKIDSL